MSMPQFVLYGDPGLIQFQQGFQNSLFKWANLTANHIYIYVQASE